MSSSEDEVEFSDAKATLTSSPEYEMDHKSDGAFASSSASEDEDVAAAFAEGPLADAEWTAQYERERKDNEELGKQLKDRLEGSITVSEWCACGNCSVFLLQKIIECYSCKKLEGCGESLETDLATSSSANRRHFVPPQSINREKRSAG